MSVQPPSASGQILSIINWGLQQSLNTALAYFEPPPSSSPPQDLTQRTIEILDSLDSPIVSGIGIPGILEEKQELSPILTETNVIIIDDYNGFEREV